MVSKHYMTISGDIPEEEWIRVRVRVSKLDEIEEENYVTQRDVIRELSS